MPLSSVSVRLTKDLAREIKLAKTTQEYYGTKLP